eukprot:scaffold4494_cov161-Amphora_coffeaeformis.AAC.10
MSQTSQATLKLISSPTGLGAPNYEESVPQIHFSSHHSHSDDAKAESALKSFLAGGVGGALAFPFRPVSSEVIVGHPLGTFFYSRILDAKHFTVKPCTDTHINHA